MWSYKHVYINTANQYGSHQGRVKNVRYAKTSLNGPNNWQNFQLSLGQIVYKTFNNICNPVLHYTKDFCIKYFCTPENAGYVSFKKYCIPMNMILFNAIHIKMLQLKNYNFQTLLPSFMMIHWKILKKQSAQF